MDKDRVDFVSIKNGSRIVPATIVSPLGMGPFPAVVINHGHGGNREEHGGFADIARGLARKGILSIRMDFPGCGESTEPFTENCLSNMISDSNASLDYIIDNYNVDKDRLGILGYSMGGRIALTIAGEGNSPYKAMGLLAPSSKAGEDLMISFLGDRDRYNELKKQDLAEGAYIEIINVFGKVETLSGKWIKDMENSHPLDSIKNFKGDMLLIYGEEDIVVPPSENKKLLSAFPRAEKKIIGNADHRYGFFDKITQITDLVIDSFAEFFEKNL